jgi:hypothetical protein
MDRIVPDRKTLGQLAKLKDSAEICDESGRVIGYFHPAIDRSLYDLVEPSVSDEELFRRSREEGGRKLRDIIADLEKKG